MMNKIMIRKKETNSEINGTNLQVVLLTEVILTNFRVYF